MDKRPDFADDLALVRDGMEQQVHDILEVIQKKKRLPQQTKSDEPQSLEKPQIAKHVVRPATRRPPPANSRPSGLQNVTTRLTPETNELLTKAALKQELKNAEPSTRQGIVETAVRDWLKRNGYARSDGVPDDSE